MNDTALLWPVMTLVMLTFAVWLTMYRSRVGFMKRNRIHPQKVATRSQSSEQLAGCAGPADNFMNLFELPVLFYALVPLLLVTGWSDQIYLIMAWVFVVLRVLHSLIHVTYNRVLHRFWVYCIGGFVLFAMWGRFMWQLASA